MLGDPKNLPITCCFTRIYPLHPGCNRGKWVGLGRDWLGFRSLVVTVIAWGVDSTWLNTILSFLGDAMKNNTGIPWFSWANLESRKLTAIAFENMASQKGNESSSSHPFSGGSWCYTLVNLHSNGTWTFWRCISNWKWGYSIAMFVYQRVVSGRSLPTNCKMDRL